MSDPITTIQNNAALRAVNVKLQESGLPPDRQLAVSIMASVLATRRLLALHAIDDRGRRRRVIKEAVHLFETRLREYVKPETGETKP